MWALVAGRRWPGIFTLQMNGPVTLPYSPLETRKQAAQRAFVKVTGLNVHKALGPVTDTKKVSLTRQQEN